MADDLAITVDEELFEVPGQVAALECLVPEPLVERVLPLAVRLHNLHHWEFDLVVILDEIEDLLRLGLAGAAVGLLRAELVARES